LLCNVLHWICESIDLALTVRFFELRLLTLVGYRPQLFDCPRCNARLEPEESFFSAEAGGALCPRCGEGAGRARAISLGALKVLRYLQTHEYEQCAQLQLRKATHSELEEVLQGYLIHILERRLASVEFLNILRRDGLPSDSR
jgi:DNA repair protein RecO (recombination protein O)